MASCSLTVKDNPAYISKLFKEDAEQKDEEILSLLESIHGDLSQLPAAIASESKNSNKDSLNLSRKITMSTNAELQTDKLVQLGSLYQSDQTLADVAHKILSNDSSVPIHLKRLMKSALREKLSQSTDDFSVALRLVAKPGIQLLAGLMAVDHEGDLMLQEFFLLNREPNLAEIEMLADACRVPMEIISAWFAFKRDQTQKLFVVQGLATKDSRLGTKLRKREHHLREGPAMQPRIPSEFTDPDINEGWQETDAGHRSSIFKSFQQKDISGFLTRMWQNDPFKAKWSILAKAYSMIRENNTKDAAPLDKFLAITCPLIGMIPRDEYLVVMGWNIVDMDGGKKMERFFTPEISSFPESILTTNLSSEDLVTHCLHISYVQQADDNIVRNQGSTAALSMAAQPTYSSNLSFGTSTQPDLMSAQPMINSTQPIINSTQPIVNPTQSFDTSTQAIFTSALPAVLPTQTAFSPMQFGVVNAEPDNQIQQAENINHGFFFGDSVQGALFHNNNGAAGASGAVRQAVHDLGAQEFPFMDEFDPFGSSALDFDPFSMNHDAAFASNSIGTYLAPSNEQFPENFNIDDLLSSDMFDMTK
uniref:Mating-type protein MAT-1 n=1 Tax=Aureobasidium zeae TaxID=1592451 RepID=A0A482LZT4_9PEZI|nr:MAT1-1-1 [Aureobasidium zeae]